MSNPRTAFFIRRVLLVVPTLLGATFLVFLLMRVVPGDVAYLILLGPGADVSNVRVDPDELERLREQLGLNRNIAVQYVDWLGDVSRASFGESIATGRPVVDEIGKGLVLSMQIAIMAVAFGVLMGIPLGVASALRPNSIIDLVSRLWSITFLAVPNFWLGLLVLLIAQRSFDWSPPFGRNLLWSNPGDNLSQLVFPALIIGTSLMAIVARISRSSLLEVLGEDYIRTARAKGLSNPVVVVRHGLRNALIPVVTVMSVSFGNLLGGTVVMENIFAVPGLGKLLLDSIEVRNYPVVQGIVFCLAGVFILINLVVDLMYGWLDPRVSVQS